MTTTEQAASNAVAERHHVEVQITSPSSSSSSSRDDAARFGCDCVDCKLPSMSAGRTLLCASCLNRNLLLACKKTASTLSPGTSPIGRFSPSPRAYFPGMPRAVLSPVVDATENSDHLSSAVDCIALLAAAAACDNSCPSRPETPGGGGRGDSFLESDHAAKITIRSADERASNGEPGVHVLSSSSRAEEPELHSFSRESNGGCALREGGGGREGAYDSAEEKWHLFQIKKNLTVRIPNPPIEISTLPNFLQQPSSIVVPRKQQSSIHYSAAVQQKESCTKRSVFPVVRQSKPKKWAIRRDENAEAELMMRLLADTKPMLKSSAPPALPPCYVKPPSISLVSPPGDPLWKRRCIACPKSLKLKSSSICVT